MQAPEVPGGFLAELIARGFDTQDALIALGVLSAEAAALVIWWPAALILLALFCFAGVYLIELEKKRTAKPKEKDANKS